MDGELIAMQAATMDISIMMVGELIAMQTATNWAQHRAGAMCWELMATMDFQPKDKQIEEVWMVGELIHMQIAIKEQPTKGKTTVWGQEWEQDAWKEQEEGFITPDRQ